MTLANTNVLERCAHCGDVGLDYKRCSRCKTSLYCSKEHQVEHWKEHKLLCSDLNRNAKKCAAVRYMFEEYYKDDDEVQETFQNVYSIGAYLLASFQTAEDVECMRELNPQAFARFHWRCCHKDMADPSAREAEAKTRSSIVDDASLLCDADSFRSFLSSAPESRVDWLVDECVPGPLSGIDYGARGKPLECLEGAGEEELKLSMTEPVLRVLQQHLEEKREHATDLSPEARIKLLAQCYKLAAALNEHSKALALARERHAVVHSLGKDKSTELFDAYYDVIVSEMHAGAVDDAARHADEVVERYFPRDDWELDVTNWIRFRLLQSHAKLRRGDIWGAHVPLQEGAAVMFRWCGEKRSPEGGPCPLGCGALGVTCNPCKFVLDYFLYTDNRVFNGVMTKFDIFALSDQEQAQLAAISGDAKSLQITDSDKKAMAAYRKKLMELLA